MEEGTFRRYPIGIQDFEDLRNNDYIYVDKTALIYQLVNTNKIYFLSRPRRFGKSLLVSTLEAYFLGKKELFNGLDMEQLEKDWTVYPVLHIDFSGSKYMEAESLRASINVQLLLWENVYGRQEGEDTFSLRLEGIIRRAYEQTGQRVVILIDEYDKPMLQAIGNEELQKEFRNTMKAFYSVLKTMDGCIQFAFLTGVTKFGKVSVFSDLNNLDDISMRKQYVDICGVSEKELHDNLEIELHELADANELTYGELCNRLREYYDGYHFTYNSIIKFLLPFYANTNAVESEFEIQKFVREVEAGDYDSFFRRLRSFFADTPYELIRDLELHYQNVLFIVFKLVGFYVKAEYHTSEGRIDLVLQTDKFVYVIEFKLDGTAEDALRQINEKHYALPFEAGGNRRLFKIGVNFNAKMRNIEKWIVE